MRSMCGAGNWPDGRPARQPRSSTARASRAPKKGGLDRSARLRCGQEDQRQEAACPGRHARPAAAGHRACRRYPGSRRRRAADEHAVRAVSVPAEALRRQRLPGAEIPGRLAPRLRQVNVEIVKRSDVGKFVVLPKRWIVERTIAWLNRCRRLAKDWECLNRNALAFLRWASIRLMLRKLCQTLKMIPDGL